MAELPATGSLGTGQLDTRDLLVAGVPISISSKYLYLYLALKLLTCPGSPDTYLKEKDWKKATKTVSKGNKPVFLLSKIQQFVLISNFQNL